jgi:hypothetical protein
MFPHIVFLLLITAVAAMRGLDLTQMKMLDFVGEWTSSAEAAVFTNVVDYKKYRKDMLTLFQTLKIYDPLLTNLSPETIRPIAGIGALCGLAVALFGSSRPRRRLVVDGSRRSARTRAPTTPGPSGETDPLSDEEYDDRPTIDDLKLLGYQILRKSLVEGPVLVMLQMIGPAGNPLDLFRQLDDIILPQTAKEAQIALRAYYNVTFDSSTMAMSTFLGVIMTLSNELASMPSNRAKYEHIRHTVENSSVDFTSKFDHLESSGQPAHGKDISSLEFGKIFQQLIQHDLRLGLGPTPPSDQGLRSAMSAAPSGMRRRKAGAVGGPEPSAPLPPTAPAPALILRRSRTVPTAKPSSTASDPNAASSTLTRSATTGSSAAGAWHLAPPALRPMPPPSSPCLVFPLPTLLHPNTRTTGHTTMRFATLRTPPRPTALAHLHSAHEPPPLIFPSTLPLHRCHRQRSLPLPLRNRSNGLPFRLLHLHQPLVLRLTLPVFEQITY